MKLRSPAGFSEGTATVATVDAILGDVPIRGPLTCRNAEHPPNRRFELWAARDGRGLARGSVAYSGRARCIVLQSTLTCQKNDTAERTCRGRQLKCPRFLTTFSRERSRRVLTNSTHLVSDVLNTRLVSESDCKCPIARLTRGSRTGSKAGSACSTTVQPIFCSANMRTDVP